MVQKTFYINLTNLKLPEIKTVSAEISNKGLIRKKRKNKIRLVDNNSVISHIYVRREKHVRGNFIKLLKTKLQHRRDDFYAGNVILATSKINYKNPANNLLQKLKLLRRNKKKESLKVKFSISAINKKQTLSKLNFLRESKKVLIKKIHLTHGDKYEKINIKNQKRIKSFFSKNAHPKISNKKDKLNRSFKKRKFHTKITKQSSKKTVWFKKKSFSNKFPLIILKKSGWAGYKGFGSGIKTFLPKSNSGLAKNDAFLHLQEKTQLLKKNWKQLKRLSFLIPFRIIPAILGKKLKIIPVSFKKNYYQVSLKKWKKTRAYKGRKGRKNRNSIKGIFLHSHKRVIKKKKDSKIENKNETKSNKKNDQQFFNKWHSRNRKLFSYRNSSETEKSKKNQTKLNTLSKKNEKSYREEPKNNKNTTFKS